MILKYQNISPDIHETVFLASSAVIIGNVVVNEYSSIWFNAVVRGDVNYIKLGQRTNIQDGCILHVTNNGSPLIIGSDVTIGHNAVIHSCTVKDNALIGMGAVILDNSVINSNSIVGAGSLIKENFHVPAGVLVAGIPAKIIRELSPEEISKIKASAERYVDYAKNYGIGY